MFINHFCTLFIAMGGVPPTTLFNCPPIRLSHLDLCPFARLSREESTLRMIDLQKTGGWGAVMGNQLPLSSNVPTCNSHSETQGPPCTTIILALSFHSFTNCPFSIPFVLTFMHRMGDVSLQLRTFQRAERITSHESPVTPLSQIVHPHAPSLGL